jgi:hypothetical protein
MVYIPDIVDYKPFYIQAESNSVAKNTIEWGLVAKVNPYPLLPNPKQPYSNSWNDENGDDEWCDKMYYESIEFTVSFYIKAFDSEGKTAKELVRNQIDDFFAYIRDGEFRIYDSYNGIGRRKVRYAGYEEDQFTSRNDWAKAIFSIKFKVNDPVTRMVLSNNSIVEK